MSPGESSGDGSQRGEADEQELYLSPLPISNQASSFSTLV